jgi:hypothetical protein
MTANTPFKLGRLAAGLFLSAGLATAAMQAEAAATIQILNLDGAGEGFNDPTPAAPVGGNAGTTLGEQRLIAFQHAADIWGATLTSSQTIIIRASFDPLTCTATTAVLGSAGAYNIWYDFPNAAKAGTWYPQALANKLAGEDLSGGDPDGQDIQARFNSRLGLFADCLPGSPFYLGLDNNHGPLVDLVTVLLHEFGHGLGFQTFTSGSTGAPFFGVPSIWDHYMLDNTTSKLWIDMNDAERAASALKARSLVWTGTNVTASVPNVLSVGVPRLTISGPAAGATAGDHLVGAASFGPPLGAVSVTGQLMPVVDQANGTGLACNPLSANNALAVRGRIALVDRGTCTFAVKTKNAQNAGAIGVVVADNAAGSPPAGMSGTDATITIPSVRITQADGIALKAQLARRSRTTSGVIADLGVNLGQYAGADANGRALLFTPNPYQSGSSVSHWDTVAFPNLLMEPSINADLLHSVIVPYDLTFDLLQDIGW